MKPLTANERAKAEATGIDTHPGAFLPDPPHVEWAQTKKTNLPDRYGGELAPTLALAGERLTDPDGVSRSTAPVEPAPKRPKRYRAGCVDLSVDAVVGNSAIDTLWSGSGAPERATRVALVKSVLEAIKPKNELEGLLAAQLIGAHGSAMECYRLAMVPTQPPAIRSENLNQAAKASRTFATLLEALDRHRGKGSQQRVRVEHVHVYEGGQAIVGHVAPGGRGRKAIPRQSHAKQPAALGHACQPAMRCEDPEREVVPSGSDAERPVPNARRR